MNVAILSREPIISYHVSILLVGKPSAGSEQLAPLHKFGHTMNHTMVDIIFQQSSRTASGLLKSTMLKVWLIAHKEMSLQPTWAHSQSKWTTLYSLMNNDLLWEQRWERMNPEQKGYNLWCITIRSSLPICAISDQHIGTNHIEWWTIIIMSLWRCGCAPWCSSSSTCRSESCKRSLYSCRGYLELRYRGRE